MFRSFKLKIAAFSLSTSGLILLAFASLFLSVIRRAGLERIDRHLQALAKGQLCRRMPAEHWSRFGASLSSVFGENGKNRFLVRATDAEGNPFYTSPEWPSALAVALPEPGKPEPMPPDSLGPPEPPEPDTQPPSAPPPPRPRLMRPPRGGGRGPFSGACLSRPRFRTIDVAGTPWRFVSVRNPDITLQLGTDLTEHQAEVKRLTMAFVLAGPFGLLLLAAGGWLLAGQALRPVKILTQVANGMTAQGLSQRVCAPGADREFQALIDVINGMLDRLETSFAQAARFSADAAHELKTPLTILQGQLNQFLQHLPVGSEEQRTCAGLLDEVQRLKSIIRKLLLLAQSDAGQLRLTLERVCLSDKLRDLCQEDAPLLAPGLTCRHDLQPNVWVEADPDLLQQLLQNILSNAVKHNRTDGEIECRLKQEGSLAVVQFANTLAHESGLARDRLFDRFYRGDPSHSRRVDGSGLGLSLAREISRAHGGELRVAEDETRPGWIAFRLTLPVRRA